MKGVIVQLRPFLEKLLQPSRNKSLAEVDDRTDYSIRATVDFRPPRIVVCHLRRTGQLLIRLDNLPVKYEGVKPVQYRQSELRSASVNRT